MSNPDAPPVPTPQSNIPPVEAPIPEAAQPTAPAGSEPAAEPAPSYVKLAMRNMVRKGGKSLFHFTLTVSALVALLVGLSYLTR